MFALTPWTVPSPSLNNASYLLSKLDTSGDSALRWKISEHCNCTCCNQSQRKRLCTLPLTTMTDKGSQKSLYLTSTDNVPKTGMIFPV